MSTQTAQLEAAPSSAPQHTAGRTVADDMLYPERPLNIARGIVNAILIAAPFWALFAFALYLLI
jgi:hypothetical protein